MDVRALPGKKTGWAWVVSTFFGVGLMQPGPGTFGSCAAVALWYAAAAVATAIGIPAATIVARESGREDPGHVVIDEVAGQLIALIAMPADWQHAVIGLLLFRAFDITKPPPVRNLEKLRGGVGIMLDDVAAGVLALGMGLLVRIWY